MRYWRKSEITNHDTASFPTTFPLCVFCEFYQQKEPSHLRLMASATQAFRSCVRSRRISYPSIRATTAPQLSFMTPPCYPVQPVCPHPVQQPRSSRAFSTTRPIFSQPKVDDAYKTSVYDLLSLKGKTILITGGARGIGLALAWGCVEVGGNVAILDALETPNEDFEDMKNKFPESKIEYYR